MLIFFWGKWYIGIVNVNIEGCNIVLIENYYVVIGWKNIF